MAASRMFSRAVLVYVGAVNAGSAGLFYYDKSQAQNGGRRVPEKKLCETALYGGWIGGLLAMQLFRHKTKKQSFQRKYAASIGYNALVSLPLSVLLVASPQFRATVARDVAALLGRTRPPPPPPGWRGGRRPPRFRR